MTAAHASLTGTMRLFAWIDLPIVTVMAIPGLSHGLFDLIGGLDTLLGFGQGVGDWSPMAWLFLNVAGVLGVLWALMRLGQSENRALCGLDAWGRLAVAALVIGYVTLGGVTPVVLVFLISGLAGAAFEFRALERARWASAVPRQQVGGELEPLLGIVIRRQVGTVELSFHHAGQHVVEGAIQCPTRRRHLLGHLFAIGFAVDHRLNPA